MTSIHYIKYVYKIKKSIRQLADTMREGQTERRGARWVGGREHRSVLILFWFVFSHQGEKMNRIHRLNKKQIIENR